MCVCVFVCVCVDVVGDRVEALLFYFRISLLRADAGSVSPLLPLLVQFPSTGLRGSAVYACVTYFYNAILSARAVGVHKVERILYLVLHKVMNYFAYFYSPFS